MSTTIATSKDLDKLAASVSDLTTRLNGIVPANAQTIPQNFTDANHELSLADIQASAKVNSHSSGEFGPATAAQLNNAFAVADYSSTALWAVGGIIAILLGFRFLKKQKII